MFLACLFFLCTSCYYPKLWGQSREELFIKLEIHDYSFFDTVDTERYEQVLQLGKEAPFYFALHLSDANRIAEERKMLEIGRQHSPEPFKFLCMQELTRIGSASEKLEAVEQLLAPDYRNTKINVPALEKQRFELLLELGRYTEISPDIPNWYYSHAMTEQLAASFPLLPAGFPEVFSEITGSRTDVYRKEYQRAWIHAKAVLESGAGEAFQRIVLSDFGKAALYGSPDYPDDGAFFDLLSEKTDNDETKYILSFYAGRLYGQAGYREKAQERFSSAINLAVSDTDYDNALWYYLDAAGKGGANSLFAALSRYAKTWKNPSVFSDLLDAQILLLVQKRDWARILALRVILSGYADLEICARLDYLAARSGKLSDEKTREAFMLAFESGSADGSQGGNRLLYYRVLSAEALGLSIGSPEEIGFKVKKGGEASGADDEASAVLHGFIKYKLTEKVYPAAVKMYPSISVSLAEGLGALLSASGRESDALRLIALALGSTNAPITDDNLKLLYPRPWLPEVSSAAERFNISEYLLYALIRSESYFQADVLSNAGAIGLTQIMAPTAEDIASKLKIEAYDLREPETNITFGAYYLAQLIGRLDGHILPSLFAYNAGITRVRAWQKTAADLEDDLFLETLPYGETRGYGRKVLAAAAVYGYLYYQKTTGQIVREIF